jgi:hypothetical protein
MESGEKDLSRWPTGWILGYGTLGSRNPAGRRYHIRSAIALILFLIVWPVTFWLQLEDQGVVWKIIAGLTPGVAYGYIAWEARRYWQSLDELGRRLMLESAACTYLVGIAAGMFFGGISFLFFDHPWALFLFNPLWFIMLEPVRGIILYRLTRRY